MTTIAVIHTGPVTVLPIKEQLSELIAHARVINIMDDSLLNDVRAAGHLTPEVASRIYSYMANAQAMGADLAYVGTRFIATQEAHATENYKKAIVSASASDIIYTNLFTGVHGNYIRESIVAAGLDPEQLPESDKAAMNFGDGSAKAWKDIWGAGQGVGLMSDVPTVDALVQRLKHEYDSSLQRVSAR